jgi:hypothetical protein
MCLTAIPFNGYLFGLPQEAVSTAERGKHESKQQNTEQRLAKFL